jgi:FtsH-binding integral membrane protein
MFGSQLRTAICQALERSNPMDDFASLSDQASVPQSSALSQVYGWMTGGLAVTGAVAFLTLQSQSMLDFINENALVYWGLIVLELIGVFILSSSIDRLSGGAATVLFLGYSALNGLTLSGIFMYYTGASVASTFFIAAGTFAVMSLYGATTKRDLSSFGSIAIMGLIGLILAMVVNLFFQSSPVYWVITIAGVLVFVVLTAADTQRIQSLMARSNGMGNVAILGALTLYLDFINLFLYMLRLFGVGREDAATSV